MRNDVNVVYQVIIKFLVYLDQIPVTWNENSMIKVHIEEKKTEMKNPII